MVDQTVTSNVIWRLKLLDVNFFHSKSKFQAQTLEGPPGAYEQEWQEPWSNNIGELPDFRHFCQPLLPMWPGHIRSFKSSTGFVLEALLSTKIFKAGESLFNLNRKTPTKLEDQTNFSKPHLVLHVKFPLGNRPPPKPQLHLLKLLLEL